MPSSALIVGLHHPSNIEEMHLPSNLTHNQQDLKDWGEVFNANNQQCDLHKTDVIHYYRSRVLWTKHQRENCAVVHIPAVMLWANRFYNRQRILKDGHMNSNDTALSMLTHRKS